MHTARVVISLEAKNSARALKRIFQVVQLLSRERLTTYALFLAPSDVDGRSDPYSLPYRRLENWTQRSSVTAGSSGREQAPATSRSDVSWKPARNGMVPAMAIIAHTNSAARLDHLATAL